MPKSLFALFFMAAVGSAAQELPRAGETVEVSIVNVDVVVTDRAGNRVRGLKREDFELRENGKVQPISNFAEYAADAERGTVRVDVPQDQARDDAQVAPREKRTLVIFFEAMQLPGFAADAFANALKETVNRLIEPGDAVSIVVWTRFATDHVEFTDEKDTIAAAIDLIADTAKGARPDEAAQQRYDAALRAEFMEAVTSARGGTDALEAPKEQVPELSLPMMTALTEMKQRVAAINSAITSMAGIEGKKILLLATRRLGEVAGAEYAYRAGSEILSPDLKARFGTERLMKSIIDNANASGVTIYPVNPAGAAMAMLDTEYYDPEAGARLAMQGFAEQMTLANETISMERIAKQTGGLMAASVNDAVKLLPRLASDATDYYSLAYRVTSSNVDRARDIIVKTRNPEYVVRSRTQFVEKSEDTRMRDRLKAALFRGPDDGATIELAATAGAPKKKARTSIVPVRVRIPIGALTTLAQANGKHAGKFSVYVAAATDLDELSDVVHKVQPFEIPEADLEKARASVFTYDLDLQVRNKSKYAAVGVFDEVGKAYGLLRIELHETK